MLMAGKDCLGMVQTVLIGGRIIMAERKTALKRAPERPELQRLLEAAKSAVLSDEQLRDQRASFVYGNAPAGSRITKESALASTDRIRVTRA
jgi:hypothetical protein